MSSTDATDETTHIIIIILLCVIIYLLYNQQRDGFETVCKNGLCTECNNKIVRDNYCYSKPVTNTCPDGYTLDDNMCSKQVTHENKEYTITVRPDKSCDVNELRIGNMCVTQAKQYFEQR
jgi:hypothetical protein